jgi:putative MATE family efflux protein
VTSPTSEGRWATAPGRDEVARARQRGVWALAWPTMTTFALQSLVGLVDFLIVKELGTQAIAAVGVAHQFHFATFAVLSAVTTGTVALVARATGAGRLDEADRVLRLSTILGALAGLALLALLPFTHAIVAAFGVEEPVVAAGGSYLRILLAFSLPLSFSVVLSSALRGAGDVRTPLVVGALVNVVNVVLNYGLVYGKLGLPRLGTDGSALGSGLALTAGAAVYAWLWHQNVLAIPRQSWLRGLGRPDALRILRIGLPTALEQSAWQGGLWLFLKLVAGFGTEPVSAYIIGVRILSFSFVPGIGFSTAASTLVGQHLGAAEPELAARSGWRASALAMGVMGAAGLAIVAVAPWVAGWFDATGSRTVELTIAFIYILGAAQPLMAVEFALGGALRGAGDTRFPLVAILTGLFVFRLGGAFTTAKLGGEVVAVWSCLLADYLVKAALLAARFARGRWKHAEL